MSSSVGSLTRHTHTHTHTDIRTSCNSSFFFCFFFLSTRHEKHALTNTRTQTLDDPQHPPTSAKKKILSIHIHGIMLCFIQTIRVPHTDGKRRPEWIRSSRVNSQIFDGEEESNKQTNRKHLGSDN